MNISSPPTTGNKWQIPSSPHEIATSALSKNVFYAESSTHEKVMRCFNIVLFAAAFAVGAYWLKFRSISILASIPLIFAARKIAATAIGYIYYPATLKSIFFYSDGERVDQVKSLFSDYKVKRITLNKNGVNYDAYCLSHTLADSQKWTLYAGGNGMILDNRMGVITNHCDLIGIDQPVLDIMGTKIDHIDKQWHRVPNKEYTNLLLVNGPAVGRSQGQPTSYQIGAGYEAALQFLEKEMNATHIIMRGASLGGGSIAEAIRMHDFEKEQKNRQKYGNPTINYLVISDRTFNHLSDAASDFVSKFISRAQLIRNIVAPFVKGMFYLLGIELNGMKAAKKLSDKNIRQIVIQHKGDDGMISAQASLAHSLIKAGIVKNKIFLQSDADDMDHYGDERCSGLPNDIEKELHDEIQTFLGTSSKSSNIKIDWTLLPVLLPI